MQHLMHRGRHTILPLKGQSGNLVEHLLQGRRSVILSALL